MAKSQHRRRTKSKINRVTKPKRRQPPKGSTSAEKREWHRKRRVNRGRDRSVPVVTAAEKESLDLQLARDRARYERLHPVL